MILAMLALAGCGGGEPRVRTNGTVAGEYVLVERQGQPLPHTMHVPDGNGRPCTLTLVRLVLTLHADGAWREVGDGSSQCQGDTAPRRDVLDYAGEYHLRGPAGDTVVLRDTLYGEAEQTGVFVRDELRLVIPQPPRDTLRYRYVRQPAGD